jgi:hypothetical protein
VKGFLEYVNKIREREKAEPLGWNTAVKFLMARKFDNQSCWTIRNNICRFRFNLLLFFIFTYFEKNIFYAKPVIHLYLDLFNVYMIRNVNLQTCYKQYI